MKRLCYLAVLPVLWGCPGERPAADGAVTPVALSPATARHTHHQFSPDGTQIAYWAPASDSTGAWKLWVANADMSAARELPVPTVEVAMPHWSEDGTRLAAVSSLFSLADVVAITVATGEVQRVSSGAGIELPLSWRRGDAEISYYGTTAGGTIASRRATLASGADEPLIPDETRTHLGELSPDGRHIAYFVQDGARLTTWLADSAGRYAREVTTEGFEVLVQNGWSPDGKYFLYHSNRTGTIDLWIYSVDSGTSRQLTRNIRNDREGQWSPDGRWIAFLSDRGRQTDVWLVPAAGGEEVRVTNTAQEETQLRWSMSGTLSFEVDERRIELWSHALEGGAERKLLADSVRLGGFWVSPRGDQIAVLLETGGGVFELGVLPVNGGAYRRLVSGDAQLSGVAWAPDGRRITYRSDASGSGDIWVVDVATADARAVVAWPGDENGPQFSADGSQLFFRSDRDSRFGDIWRVPLAGGEPTRLTTTGGIFNVVSVLPADAVIVSEVNPKTGVLGISRVRLDGRHDAIWDRSNVINAYPTTRGDSVIAMIEQPQGPPIAMLLSADGRGGRAVLRPGESLAYPSFNGRQLLYTTSVNGANDLHVLDLDTGTKRRVTSTAESEDGAEFTPDDRSLVFRRVTAVRRIYRADVRRLVAPTP